MPLVTESYDSLPYIDPEPTLAQRTAAQALIDAALALPTAHTDDEAEDEGSSTTTTHPSLPSLLPSTLTPLLASEHARIAAGSTPLNAIDLSRYEASSSSAAFPSALAAAYTSSTYLASRTTALAHLDAHGKEQWLAGNQALAAQLGDAEKALARRREEIDRVAVERQRAQEAVGAEVQGLEKAWREGVARVLETEVAAEGVRGEVLRRRREGAL